MIWGVNLRFMKKPNGYEAEARLPVRDKRKRRKGVGWEQNGNGATEQWQETQGHLFLPHELRGKRKEKKPNIRRWHHSPRACTVTISKCYCPRGPGVQNVQ